VILAGSAIARTSAQETLSLVADKLDAQVATTPDARDAFDNQHPRFLGVAGAMGHATVARAVAQAQLVMAIGTRLPLLARQGLEPLLKEKRLLSVGHDRPYISGTEALHLEGDPSSTLRTLALRAGNAPLPQIARVATSTTATNTARFSCAEALRAIDQLVPESTVVLVDAGNTGASAIHHVRAPRRGRSFVAIGMAGMGWTFGAATGAALATGKRCFVLAGDGAFFMHGLEIHTAVEHALPITYVIFDNRAHGMCLVRERLLLGENAGYNAFRPSHLGAGLAAMFPGLRAADCTTRRELESLVERSLAHQGPSVISVELEEVDVPPFTTFQERAPTTATVAREAADG
jgi:acetolactate synthase-1/2/3 large subunit